MRLLAYLAACGLIACAARGKPPAAATVASVDGTRIHYLERRPTAPESTLTLVFVPGWMMPGDVWEAQLAYFGARHRVVAIDPRSQGKSDKVADGNYPAMRARDLSAVIERLGLQRVVLIGASSGVTDVAAYVDQFGTDRLSGIVLVHGVPGADFDANVTPGLMQWAQRFQTERREQTEKLVRSLFVTPPSEVLVRELVRKALAMPTSSAIAAFFGSQTSDYRPALAKFDRPTLIITARNAWLRHYEAMRDAIAGAEFEAWDGVGHALYISEAPRFNARVREFLRQLEER
jgi:pimeloyl-ACP methyl ester carboxylesterase